MEQLYYFWSFSCFLAATDDFAEAQPKLVELVVAVTQDSDSLAVTG